jgi:Rap1a immunity proteins
MTRWTRIGMLSIALWSVGLIAPQSLHAQTQGFTIADLKLQSAGQLVDVCTIDATHSDYVAALAFCYGFFEGAIRYAEAIAGPEAHKNLVCPPADATRLQAVEVFVTYIKANPQYASEPPVDAIYRSLMPHWPCAVAP